MKIFKKILVQLLTLLMVLNLAVVACAEEVEAEEVTYTIVGSTESDPMANKISDESPIGKALLGKKPGEEVTADTPGGAIKMKVLEIL